MKLYSEEIIKHCQLLQSSFKHLFNRPLAEDANNNSKSLAENIVNAPYVIVSHDTQPDPVFNFANNCALELWGMSWEDFTSLPSRYSAEAMERSQREEFLKQAEEKGYVDKYSGIRITKDGRRFRITDAIIWNLYDEKNNFKGQAATFSKWKFL